MIGTTPELTLLIPVFNGQRVLPATLAALHEASENAPVVLEILFVDDGSLDSSQDLLESFERSHPGLARLVRLDENQGINSALGFGFRQASAPVVATVEMHLEHEIDEVFRLFDVYRNSSPQVDAVCAYRIGRQGPLWRLVASRLVNLATRRIAGLPIRDIGCLLKVWRTPFGAETFSDPSFGNMLRSLCRANLAEVGVRFRPGPAYSSSFSLVKLIRAFVQTVSSAFEVRFMDRRD